MRSSDFMTRGFSAEISRLGSNVDANISSLQPLQQDLRDFHPHPRLGLLGRGTHVSRADNTRVADEPQVVVFVASERLGAERDAGADLHSFPDLGRRVVDHE